MEDIRDLSPLESPIFQSVLDTQDTTINILRKFWNSWFLVICVPLCKKFCQFYSFLDFEDLLFVFPQQYECCVMLKAVGKSADSLIQPYFYQNVKFYFGSVHLIREKKLTFLHKDYQNYHQVKSSSPLFSISTILTELKWFLPLLQLSFSRYTFLSDYLTDLKLHNTK